MADHCAICIGAEAGHTLTLECGHTFHAACICNHFRRNDGRCPLCRQGPPMAAETETVPASPARPTVTEEWNRAYDRAITDADHDTRTRKMLLTLKRWRTEFNKTHSSMRAAKMRLRAQKRKLIAKIKAFRRKAHTTFKIANAYDLDEVKTSQRMLSKMKTTIRQSRERIARKYGFVGSAPYSWTRREESAALNQFVVETSS